MIVRFVARRTRDSAWRSPVTRSRRPDRYDTEDRAQEEGTAHLLAVQVEDDDECHMVDLHPVLSRRGVEFEPSCTCGWNRIPVGDECAVQVWRHC